jgi:serine/threonine-protein kinase
VSEPAQLLSRLPISVRDTVRASLDAAASLGPRATIEPTRKKGHTTLDDALELLRELGAEGALSRRGTLGEGGMGVVHLAEQRALGREVAVKSLRADARTADATLKLLREAWITGALEHPNVIPVHDVRLDADGQPQIVLKKIEGRPWSDVIAAPDAIRERFGASDPVDWNFRVFLQVAKAIHYAHTRGFLHRDLKPENVMIGPFGEVYVVDWGLAVALTDDGTGRFPLAADAKDLAGTPCYMAPEMLGGEGAALDARTDVFLLGAVLFEVVTGKPPREGTNVLEVVAQVVEPVVLPEGVPDELASIVERALALSPSNRFEGAQELHDAVLAYLGHRGSIQLAQEAYARFEELARLDGSDETRADTLFSECRFGFQQALRAWPANALAQRGLGEALTHRIRHEIGRGNALGASHLLAELPAPDPELRRAVEEARRLERGENERRAALERDHDPSIGRRTRAFVGLIMSSVWVAAPLVMWALGAAHPAVNDYPGAISGTLALMGIGLGLAIWARDSLSKTRINRQLVMAVRVSLISQLVLLVGGYVGDIPFVYAHTILFLTWGIGVAFTANTIDARLYPAAGAFLVGFFVLLRWPELRHPISALANLGLLLSVVLLWARPQDDLIEPIERRIKERRDRRSGRP